MLLQGRCIIRADFESEHPFLNYVLEPNELAAKVAADRDVVLIHVASAEAYAAGHIAGAIHVAPGELVSGIKPATGQLPEGPQRFGLLELALDLTLAGRVVHDRDESLQPAMTPVQRRERDDE